MSEYVKLKDLAKQFSLQRGDTVMVSSDLKRLLYECVTREDDTDMNLLLDGIIDIIGPEGTLFIPTFNWDFCKGKTFDYYKTPCKTGSLGKTALKRSDFKRTKHPIYSFAVWGKDQEELCNRDYQSSFGIESPFTYCKDHNAKNLFIDVECQHSFTFVHYVEEQVGISYRYLKDFTADYIDENGTVSKRTYSMNVRDLDKDIYITIYPFEEEFIKAKAARRFQVNGIDMKEIEMGKVYPMIADDVKNNKSRKICTYSGQDEEWNGNGMMALCQELFPICRSLTGNGVRETFSILKRECPELRLTEVPSGTEVFDWTIPREWNIKDAYIKDESGKKLLDFHETNLHVLGYSTPLDKMMNLEELKEHIYTLEDQPELIPYVTSYYKERFGFAMTDRQKKSLKQGMYHAVIDSELKDGFLTYGEILIPGETEEEIMISTYVCHPSMANNECSGPVVAIALANYVKQMKHRRYSYRFVFTPETIGAITYLSKNMEQLREHVIAGFNLSCVGDNRTYSMIHSRYSDTLADKVLANILKYHYPDFKDYSYLKRGSDERQYQAPGVDIPLVGFCRSKYHEYPEYHTSGDDMTLVSEAGFQGAYDVMKKCIQALEYNHFYRLTCFCEPQLGKRGLVPTMSSKETYKQTLHLKDLIAYADGRNDLIDISNLIQAPIDLLIPLVEQLVKAELLEIMK